MRKDSILNSPEKEKGTYFSNGRDIYLIDLDTNEKLGLMGLPHEIAYNPETSWAVLKPYGKNTPNYQYTGAEDTIELEITWWAQKNDVTDVISKCKWIEAVSKADGDRGRPHIMRLMWGTLFRKSMWIVKSAPYQIMDFLPSAGLRPLHAKQKVTLARYNPLQTNHETISDWEY